MAAPRSTFTPDVALDSLLEASDEAVLVFDEALVCRRAGRRVAALLGFEPRSVLGLGRAELLGRLAAQAPEGSFARRHAPRSRARPGARGD